MRPTLFIAASVAVAMAGQALAANQPAAGASNMPSTDAPMQSTAPTSHTATPDTTAPPSSATTAPPTGSAADTSATAGGAAALSVGEPVKDNTGATIGAISSLSTGANGQQMAVIKMGNDTFQAPADRLGVANGAATINLSQSQITSMLHPPAGGK